MRSQDEVRNSLNEYITSNGCKAKWIAEQCGGIDESLLCAFRQGKRVLWDSTLLQIECFLISKGY